MTTQWGRNGRDLRQGLKSGPARLLFAFIAFDIGIIAGYGLSLYLDRENRGHTEQISDQKVEIQSLQEKLSTALADNNTLESLQNLNQALQEKVDNLEQQLSQNTGPEPKTAEKLTATTGEISSLKAQLADANLKSAELEKQVADLWEKAGEQKLKEEELQKALDDNERLQKLLAEKETAVQTLSEERTGLQTKLAETEAAARESAAVTDGLRAELEKAEKQTIPELQAEIYRLRASGAASTEQDSRPAPASPETMPDNSLHPRDRAVVLQVLENAPSLGNLDSGQKEKLIKLLVSGACVTTSLKQTTGDVPIVLLAHLIKELGGDC